MTGLPSSEIGPEMAVKRVRRWWLKQHPKVTALQFQPFLSERTVTNSIIQYVDGAIRLRDLAPWLINVTEADCDFMQLTPEECTAHMKKLTSVVLAASDKFCTRETVVLAASVGTTVITFSTAEPVPADVVQTCEEHGIVAISTGLLSIRM